MASYRELRRNIRFAEQQALTKSNTIGEVMQCKIDHNAHQDYPIPRDLCRACNPHLNAQREQSVAADEVVTHESASTDEHVTRYAKRKLRELRAEVRELTHQLELMEKYPTPKTQLDAVKEKLRSAQRELYLNA